MERTFTCLILLIFSVCFIPHLTLAQTQTSSSSTAITVVSDTTDTIESMAQQAMPYSTAQIDSIATSTIPQKVIGNLFSSDSIFGNSLLALFGLGAGVFPIILVILLVCLILSPIIAIILILYLIFRRKKQPTRALQENTEGIQASHKPTQEEFITVSAEGKKDKAIIRIAIGVGIAVFSQIIAIKIGLAIGLFVVCYGVGLLITALRQKRREDNDNQKP